MNHFKAISILPENNIASNITEKGRQEVKELTGRDKVKIEIPFSRTEIDERKKNCGL